MAASFGRCTAQNLICIDHGSSNPPWLHWNLGSPFSIGAEPYNPTNIGGASGCQTFTIRPSVLRSCSILSSLSSNVSQSNPLRTASPSRWLTAPEAECGPDCPG